MKLVSVFLITYKHEQFIGQAIESIVSQKVNFDFELVIGEDYSPDNTRAICEQYAQKYPNIIKLLPSDRNYGPMPNTIRTLQECTGKYIALCEGDDYWIDPLKLQKQVDFLEAHPDFSMTFADAEIVGDVKPGQIILLNNTRDVYTIEDFIMSPMNIIPTATLLFRNVLPNPLPEFCHRAIAGDTIIQLLAADKGKAWHFHEKHAVYRIHSGGVTRSKENIEKGEIALKQAYRDLNEHFGFRYDNIFRRRFLEMSKMKLIYGSREKKGLEKIRHYFKTIPDYFKYSKGINFRELAYYHLILFFPSLLKTLKK